jgi:hypothetical protein
MANGLHRRNDYEQRETSSMLGQRKSWVAQLVPEACMLRELQVSLCD